MALRERTLRREINGPLYTAVKLAMLPFLRVYLRLGCTGRKLIPDSGPVIFAANHRSFLDPFIVGASVRRPVYCVAKRELFARPWRGWLISSLGGFPIDRGSGDIEAVATAAEILRRGECVLIFPEGKPVRRGPLRTPQRGVGKLALEAGVPVVPIALHGTESVRRGWRIRPRKVKIRFGLPISLPSREHASAREATGVTARIWMSISLQWEWLGGEPAAHLIHRAGAIGQARALHEQGSARPAENLTGSRLP